MKEGRGGNNVVAFRKPIRPFDDVAAAPTRIDKIDSVPFFTHLLGAQGGNTQSGTESIAALRQLVFSLLEGSAAEPFAGVARTVFLSFADPDRFPLQDDLNEIVSTLTEQQRDALLNGFWHRGELLQLLTPARIATLALKGKSR